MKLDVVYLIFYNILVVKRMIPFNQTTQMNKEVPYTTILGKQEFGDYNENPNDHILEFKTMQDDMHPKGDYKMI